MAQSSNNGGSGCALLDGQSLADVRVKYVISRVIWLLDHFIVSYNFLVGTNLCLAHLKSWDPIDQKDATFKNIESHIL